MFTLLFSQESWLLFYFIFLSLFVCLFIQMISQKY
jgi:hypothetical protein